MSSPATTPRWRNLNSIFVRGTLLVTSTLTVMAAATIAPSLPAMQAHFSDVPNVEFLVRLLLTLPALFIVIGAPIAGYIVDRFGRKPLLVASVVLYGLAGSSGYTLSSLTAILAGRALLGVAVAGIMTSVTTLIADYYSGAARIQMLGYQAAFVGFSATLYLSAGGFLADLDWRNPFLIYLLALIILPFISIILYEPTRESDTEQYPNTKSENHKNTLLSGKLPIKLLVLIYGMIMLTQIVFFLVPVHLPFFLQDLIGANAKQSGFAISAIAFFYASGALLSAKLGKTIDHLAVIVLSFGLVGGGFILIGSSVSYGQVLVGLALGGFGNGLVIPNLNAWLAAEAPEALRGRALGGFTTFMFLGQFISPIVMQPVIQWTDLGSTYALTGGTMLAIAAIVGMRRWMTARFAAQQPL